MGLKDQLLALKWVQRNIASFNGDPDNVTIFGESAGAASVHYHVLSQASNGLFHKAILQSGVALNSWALGFHAAVEFANFIGHNVSDEKEALEVLKNTPVEVLYENQEKFMEMVDARGRPFSPVVEYPNDTAFITKNAIDLIKAGQYNKVPMIIGFNTREGMLFDVYKVLARLAGKEVKSPPPDSEEAILSLLKIIYRRIKEVYFKSADVEDDARILTSDVIFTAVIIAAIKNHLETSKEHVYVYRMSLIAGLNFLKNLAHLNDLPGVCHADDLGYLFKSVLTPEVKPGSLEDVSLRRFVKLWTNFAKFSNPTPEENELGITWAPAKAEDIEFLDVGENLSLETNPESERWAVWRELFQLHPRTSKFFLTVQEFGDILLNPFAITVNQGQLRGCSMSDIDGNNFFSFLGIPYARPPVGELRFKPPLPAEPWKGVRDALEPGNRCYSRDDISRVLEGSEDCLYLNVFTKALPQSNKRLRPVMVWIHGGGFAIGSNKPALYGPEFLMIEDIVLVTLNYRLGVVGFLSLEDPSLGVPGNMGLKDQLLALKWVQRNIASFNGDPDNVTIFGESAGAASVHYHVMSQASNGLFHKAIFQSGVALNSWALGFHAAVEFANFIGHNVSDEKEALEVLKNTPVEVLYENQEKFMEMVDARGRPFSPVVEYPNDTAFITKNAIDLIKAGQYNKVPMIIGFNTREGMLFDVFKVLARLGGKEVKSPPPDSEEAILSLLKVRKESEVSQIIYRRIKEVYFKSADVEDDGRILASDIYFTAEIIAAIKNHLETSQENVYVYRMSLVAGLNFLKNLTHLNHLPGVCHADDLGYLFKSVVTPEVKPGSLEDVSLRRFVKLWTNFAKFSNPTPEKDELGVTWAPAKAEDIPFLDVGENLSLETNPESERWAIWRELFQLHPRTLKFFLTVQEFGDILVRFNVVM
ncbi:hypothetical protein NQ318_018952 [Aromia moschata]|uniref:Carboxylesterase type B domain-containing protein n=1 Tax=Aromia moschata TaxID=1265417 RepID=A0AAV8ZJE0_9CUCU|nr:hypothetical protein NQ318_018952 [Aromia moschata]